MKPHDASFKEHFFIREQDSVEEASSWMKRILEAKYEKANLNKVESECNHLDENEQVCLLQLLTQHNHYLTVR